MYTRKPFSEARSELTEIVNHVAFGQDRYVLTGNGKELAALVSLNSFKIFFRNFGHAFKCHTS